MSFAYSPKYLPAAPVLPIRLSAPFSTRYSPPLRALIDTGADYSMAPIKPLIDCDAPPVRWAYMRGIWGERRQVMLYMVDMHIDDMVLPGIEIAGVQNEESADISEEAILGRNVINQILLLLDGPNRQLDLLQRRPARF